MKFMISVLIVLSTLFASSCRREEIPAKPVNNVISPIIWKHERKYKALASNNYVYNNTLIQGYSSTDGDFHLLALSLDSGKIIWQQEGYPRYFDPYSTEYSSLSDNRLVLSGSSFTRVVNVENGQTLWEDNLENGYYNICVIDNYVYKTSQTQLKSSLYRYDINTGARQLLFSITKENAGDGVFEPDIRMPVKWEDSFGNDILIMPNRSYGNGNYRMDIIAWNLSADSMLWYRKGLDTWASSSRPVIDDNRVYFFSISTVHCIDAATGNSIWSFEKDSRDNISGFKTANILLVKDKLIAKPDGFWMYAIDKMTGKLIWVNENTASMPYLLREHMDTIWFSSGGVYAIDANTGRKLIDGWDNNGQGPFWSNPVVHHPTLGYIYTTDGDYIYCLDPRRMK